MRKSTSEGGFSLIEVLLGLALSLCLALGLAPVLSSLQALAAREVDMTVWSMQAGVAAARFEQDVRLSGYQDCPFSVSGTVLQAGPSQVVLLEPSGAGDSPLLVEWELINGSLMRRWGTCPSTLPTTFAHSLYSDSKTMLEDVDTVRSAFSFKVAGGTTGAVASSDTALVDEASLVVVGRSATAAAAARVVASALVGR